MAAFKQALPGESEVLAPHGAHGYVLDGSASPQRFSHVVIEVSDPAGNFVEIETAG